MEASSPVLVVTRSVVLAVLAATGLLFPSCETGVASDDGTSGSSVVAGPGNTVLVPSGLCKIGAGPTERDSNVWPEQNVYLDSFYIDSTEVTNLQFQEFLHAHPEWKKEQVGPDRAQRDYLSHFVGNVAPSDKLSHPVTWVSWYAADSYCRAQGKRLPTAAEWEKAARGPDGSTYPWGKSLQSGVANFCDKTCPLYWRDASFVDGFPETAPVGSFPKGVSPYGALDMTGNVLEWVADWYDTSETYYKRLPTRNPLGPSGGLRKVLRGGSWLNTEVSGGLRAYVYYIQVPTKVLNYIGFRCGMDAPGR